MKLKNKFSTATRELFRDAEYSCFKCGSNHAVTLHHIAGRVSSSKLNACPLCYECHAEVGHSEEEEMNYFYKTLRFLTIRGYVIDEEDQDFIQNNPRLYKVIFS